MSTGNAIGGGFHKGAVGRERKAKDLRQRWMIQPASKAKSDKGTKSDEKQVIERDTVVRVRVRVGRGAAATEFDYPFRVLGIYDKYYNKWYLGEEPWKLWPRNDQDKEERRYKLDVRMLDKDALDECDDVPLYHADFKKKDVYKTIEDHHIASIDGKLMQG